MFCKERRIFDSPRPLGGGALRALAEARFEEPFLKAGQFLADLRRNLLRLPP